MREALNEPQDLAVNTLEGAVLIIAGAGSGKTRVITHRIGRMLEKGIPQSAILALTFTNKAAREMESRVRELTGRKLQALTVSTFHAFGAKFLRDEIEILGFRKNFSIYDSTDRIELIKESLRETRLYGEKMDLYKMEQIFSNIKIGRFVWGRPQNGTSRARTADSTYEVAYKQYQQNLRLYNAVDFDDLLTLPIEILNTYPEILARYRKRYRYILVDEFQDTSFVQYQLLRLLAEPGTKSNVCVVGDDDQSIYSWRGANYENLLLYEKDFPGLLEIKLEQNYRSTSTILEAANGLISHNQDRKGKNLFSNKGEGRPIMVLQQETEAHEAAYIAGTIKKLRYQDSLSYDDFGVLVRTNGQFDVIEEAFLSENIPYRVSGGMSFFDRKEIRDILSYLRVIANHHDDVNLLRIINTPRRGIGKASIQGASDFAKAQHTSLYDALYRMNLARGSQKSLFDGEKAQQTWGVPEFLDLISEARDEFFSGGPLSKKVKALVDKIDYWSYLVSEFSKDEKIAKWKYANIEYLIKMIQDWEYEIEREGNLEERGLYAYLNRISLLTRSDGDEDLDRSKEPRGKVNLMTIHASKGLEFPVVFIAGAEEGIIPHHRSMEDAEDEGEEGEGKLRSLEEERRLFYVAITRARDKLNISSCQRRIGRRQNGDTERLPSPFLQEIPAHLILSEEPEAEESPQEAEAFFSRLKERFG
ncbi:MAG: exodeoxyribonuclease V subunit gamma [Treponema sp.]|nr:exodeoxyribonuclease V subunit gamma [Treponema sp.]